MKIVWYLAALAASVSAVGFFLAALVDGQSTQVAGALMLVAGGVFMLLATSEGRA